MILATMTDRGVHSISGRPLNPDTIRNSDRSERVYVIGPKQWAQWGLERFREGVDCVYGPTRQQFEGARLSMRDGYVHFAGGNVWDLPDTPKAASDEIYRLQDVMRDNGLAWTNTAAGAAGSILRKLWTSTEQLRPRWRAIAHDAIHPGPMVVLRGGAPWAVQLDRRAAYLRALREPIPVWSTYRYAGYWPIAKLLASDGFIRATVYVPPCDGALPPLPMMFRGVTIWPTGLIRGAWPIPLLRRAVELGAEVVTVEDACVCKVAPELGPVADRIDAISDKPLRRMMYTRAYGLCAARGGWEATPRYIAGMRRWAYHDCRRPMLTPNHPPWYRPDVAAYVVMRNTIAMLDLMDRIGDGRIIAAHVDAIWTDRPDAEGCADEYEPNGWALKSAGRCMFYAVGTYQHGDTRKAQGRPSTVPWEQVIRETSARIWRATMETRQWNDIVTGASGFHPGDFNAYSNPLTVEITGPYSMEGQYPHMGDRGAWSMAGWYNFPAGADDLGIAPAGVNVTTRNGARQGSSPGGDS